MNRPERISLVLEIADNTTLILTDDVILHVQRCVGRKSFKAETGIIVAEENWQSGHEDMDVTKFCQPGRNAKRLKLSKSNKKTESKAGSTDTMRSDMHPKAMSVVHCRPCFGLGSDGASTWTAFVSA
jgi:hypothetical protein